jgi:hypothetical protein
MKLHKLLRAVLILTLLTSSGINLLPWMSQRTLAAVKPTLDPVNIYRLADLQSVIHVPSDTTDLQVAINLVSDGGVIELANGTYPAPAGGFSILKIGKDFTIRAALGATVILDGGGTHNILRFINLNPSPGTSVVFEDITFANGYSALNGASAGVTMQYAQATFINCVFKNGRGVASDNSAGGIAVAFYSTALFINCQWIGNTSTSYGGGLVVGSHSKVYIHQSRFLNNRTNPPGHSSVAAGGAIHVGNSVLRVSNSYFEGNQAGYVGGGIYVIGNWNDATNDPQADVLVVNSTFVNNQAIRDPGVSASYPTEGGAFHLEDQSFARIYNSRFIENSANTGGGVNLYRSRLEIADSVFLGNRATGTGSANGFGAAISVMSNDGSDSTTNYGQINRPPGHLTVSNTLIQGRYDDVTTVGQAAGGIYAAGDMYHMYGLGGVPEMGTPSENRAVVDVENVVFNDLDVVEVPGASGSGVGGAIVTGLADLTLNNSLLINSDAIGTGSSSGGALAILDQSMAHITNSTFAHNSSQLFGGAVFVQGSEIHLEDSRVMNNDLGGAVYGAALFTAPMVNGRSLPVTGVIQGNLISNNNGQPFFDDDRTNGPINDVRYNNNQIYDARGVNAQIYTNSISGYCCSNLSQLNTLVIQRANRTITPKSQVPNISLSTPPSVGVLLAVPPQVLSENANGDPPPPTLAYLGYAWSGRSATLDGQAVSGNAGVSSAGTGTHTLSVGGTDFTASISQAPTPAATFSASGASPVTLNWSVTAGTFLDVAIDHGVTITSSSSGSVQVSPPVDMDFWLYVITREGGIVKSVNTGVPILNVPSTINILAGLNYSVNKGHFTIENDGGGTLQWTATSQTPNLITMDTPNGQTTTLGTIAFTLNVGSLSPGDYVGTINVDAGVGGTARVTVNVKLVGILYKIYLPLVLH